MAKTTKKDTDYAIPARPTLRRAAPATPSPVAAPAPVGASLTAVDLASFDAWRHAQAADPADLLSSFDGEDGAGANEAIGDLALVDLTFIVAAVLDNRCGLDEVNEAAAALWEVSRFDLPVLVRVELESLHARTGVDVGFRRYVQAMGLDVCPIRAANSIDFGAVAIHSGVAVEVAPLISRAMQRLERSTIELAAQHVDALAAVCFAHADRVNGSDSAIIDDEMGEVA